MQGYTIRTKAYLFQLAWNDSISNIFYNNLYPAWEASAEDLLKTKEAFDNSELFHFEFVGVEKSMNTITSKLNARGVKPYALHYTIFQKKRFKKKKR